MQLHRYAARSSFERQLHFCVKSPALLGRSMGSGTRQVHSQEGLVDFNFLKAACETTGIAQQKHSWRCLAGGHAIGVM